MPNVLTSFKRQTPIQPSDASTGTWSRTTNSGLPFISKSAAAAVSLIAFPLPVESRAGEFGAQLDGIDIPVRIATANLVSTPTLTVYRRNASLAATGAGTNMTASTIAGTLTGATVTAAATDRLLRWTRTTPAIDYSSDAKADYVAVLRLNAATTTAIRIYNAITYFSVPV